VAAVCRHRYNEAMTKLEELIRTEIRAQGPMRFDRFMDLALYSPGLGYYAKIGGISPVGRDGDFYTSVSAGPLFGRLLAHQFYQMWQLLEKPSPFWIIEQGAHDGQLARDVLEWCRAEVPDFLASIRYGIVDTSGGGSIRQKCGMEPELAPYMTWFNSLESVAEIKPSGVFFSNELIDAFPVRAIIYRSNQWKESFVVIDGKGDFNWRHFPIEDTELLSEIKARRIPPIEDYSTEINLRALDWMAGIGRIFQRGYVLTIDYGYPASVYYADHRASGTLTAYVKHHAVDEVLAEPGMRDLTSHVDFTALVRAGEKVGLSTLGLVDQQRFLLGIAHDEMNGSSGPKLKLQESLRSWNTLTHPDHLGATFYALVQAKNAPANLEGLRFARPGGLE
jgi:SAM-dependent MidA family methyltransferase